MIQSIKVFTLIFLFCHASMSMHGGRFLKTASRLRQRLPAACISSFPKQRNYGIKSFYMLAFLASTAARYYWLEKKARDTQPLFNLTWEELRAIVKHNIEEIYPDAAQAILKNWDRNIEIYRTNYPENTPRMLLADVKQCKTELHTTLKAQILNAFEDGAREAIEQPSQSGQGWLTK
jgi:hypothetical protein